MRQKITQAYKQSSYQQLREIKFEYSDGKITLMGTVRSFHVKQMAQEIVLNIDGIKHVVNSIEVANRT